jgi:glycosyltransferase involved in cell wall biosynthesis
VDAESAGAARPHGHPGGALTPTDNRATPAVSVLLTSYNREPFIAAAIESVLAQTFTDFELLIVDDGSTDGSVDVARRYLSDPRVRLVQNERNRGQFPNRNYAASIARGEYVKYHDSDDLMYPHCLSTMVTALAAEPTAAFALSAHSAWSGGPSPMLLTPRLAYQREFFGTGLASLGPAAALFRRDAFLALGGFPDEGPHSDWLFWLKACREVNTLLIYGDLYWYRIHAGQHLRGPDADYDAAVLEWKVFEALDHPRCPLTPAERDRAKQNAAGRILRVAWRDVRGGRWRLAAFRLRHTRLTIRDWLRYGRHPHADRTAGTPLTPSGEVVIPAALRTPPPADNAS